MQSTRTDQHQIGSLRIRISENGEYSLVRWDGRYWVEAVNSSGPVLQDAMRAAVPGQAPGFYVPTPDIGREARLPAA